MSRPCESRNDLLNRWVRMKREERVEKSWEKPSDPGTVRSLAVCERWRKRVCADIDQKLERLYTEPLPDAETRYLNNEVNDIIKEIRRWELRIIELGGIDYSSVSHLAPTGDLLNTGGNQYQYFGRARELPEVKEMLEQLRTQSAQDERQSKQALMARVDADYYGLADDKELTRAERALEEARGTVGGAPVAVGAAVPADEHVRVAVARILSGECQEAVVE